MRVLNNPTLRVTLVAIVATLLGALVFEPLLVAIAVGGSLLAVHALGGVRHPQDLWSPLRIFLPVYAAYNAAAVFSGRTTTAGYQLVLFVLGGVGFGLACSWVVRRSTSGDEDPCPRPRLVPDWWLVLPALVAAFATYVFLTLRAGGIPVFAENENAARVEFFVNGVFATIFVVGVGVTVTSCSAGLLSRRLNSTEKRICVALLSLSAAMLAGTGNRGMLISPAVVVIVFAFWSTRIPARRLVAVAALGLVLFSAAGYLRNSAAFGPTYDSDLREQGYTGVERYLAPGLLYLAGTSETFDRTIHHFPSEHAYMLGTEFFGPLLHRESADLFLKREFNLKFEGFGLALGAANAFYLDWGPLGVPVGFAILGLASGWLYVRARTRGGLWILGYAFWLANLLLSNYGHPFAYLATLATPLLALLCLWSPSTRLLRLPPLFGPRHAPVANSRAGGLE